LVALPMSGARRCKNCNKSLSGSCIMAS
jgi:hypothetical protein